MEALNLPVQEQEQIKKDILHKEAEYYRLKYAKTKIKGFYFFQYFFHLSKDARNLHQETLNRSQSLEEVLSVK